MAGDGSELVLCVPAGFVDAAFPDPYTVRRPEDSDLVWSLCAQSFYRPRADAEHNESHKQLIPYAIIQDQYYDNLYLSYIRWGSERRLAGKLSAGIGGHLNQRDGASSGPDGIWAGLVREIAEELGADIPAITVAELVGFLNDRSDSVGRVHFGLVYRIKCRMFPPPVDGELRNWAWMTGDMLRTYDGPVENWTRILIDAGVIHDTR